MYDTERARETLQRVLGAAQTIRRRFASISSPQAFVTSEAGLEKLDAICMQLIAIGESIKQLDKATGGTLLPRYGQVPWKRIMGIRDVLSHHYFDLDAEIVYSVCADHIPTLIRAVEQILEDLQGG